MTQHSEAWYRGYNDYFNDVNVCIDYADGSPEANDWYNGWLEAKEEIEYSDSAEDIY